MANRPYGFRPVQTRDGNSWTGKTIKVMFAAADANDTFVGDLVKFTGEGDKVPVVTRADPADARLAGAVVRFDVDPEAYALYRKGGTMRYAYIPADRNVLYSVQEDSDLANIPADSSEGNIDFVQGAGGSTTTGQSSYQIDSDTIGTLNTLPLRVVRLEGNIGNELGANAQWLVTLNLDAYSDTTGL